MTFSKPNSPDDKSHRPSPDMDERDRKTVTEREEELDDALDDSFPASDPVSPATTPQPPAKPDESR